MIFKTTFKKIKSLGFDCRKRKKILKNNRTGNLYEEVTISQILENNGIKDAIWSMQCINNPIMYAIEADIAESVLHIFENERPGDNRPREAIEAARLYAKGEIDEKELKSACIAAHKASLEVSSKFCAFLAADIAASLYYFSVYTVACRAVRVIHESFDWNASYSRYSLDSYTIAEAICSILKAHQWRKIEDILRKYLEEDSSLLFLNAMTVVATVI